MTDGETTKSHTVEPLSFDVDRGTFVATGIAAAGTTVTGRLWEWFGPGGPRSSTRWMLPPRERSPSLRVYPQQDRVQGFDFEPRADVAVSIDGYSDTARTDGWGAFNIDVEVDVQPGDLVTATDQTYTKQHVVFPVMIEHIDVHTDVVSGVGAPGYGSGAAVEGAEAGRGSEPAADAGRWTSARSRSTTPAAAPSTSGLGCCSAPHSSTTMNRGTPPLSSQPQKRCSAWASTRCGVTLTVSRLLRIPGALTLALTGA